MITTAMFEQAINGLGFNRDPHDSEACPVCRVLAGAVKSKVKETNPFSEWATTLDSNRDTEAAPEPTLNPVVPKAPKVKKPGNREREAVFRVLIAAEKALKKLPQPIGRIAGFLQGAGYAGDRTAQGNALAKYLRDARFAYYTEGALWQEMDKVNILVEANGIIVESARYQVSIDPPDWLESFIMFLRSGDYRELLA